MICFTTAALPASAASLRQPEARHQHADVQGMAEDMDINCGEILDGGASVRRWASGFSS